LAIRPAPDFRAKYQLGDRPLIALLPGSRRQEVTGILPRMLLAVRHFPQYQFVVAGVSNLPRSLYENLIAEHALPIITDAAYDLLSHAEAALVTSGTATLETALFGVPQVVCYRTSALTHAVGRMLIKVPFLSLVNLVAEREVVKELIQGELNEKNLITELQRITIDASTRQRQLDGYAEIRAKLGEVGASERAGELMVKYLRNGQ